MMSRQSEGLFLLLRDPIGLWDRQTGQGELEGTASNLITPFDAKGINCRPSARAGGASKALVFLVVVMKREQPWR